MDNRDNIEKSITERNFQFKKFENYNDSPEEPEMRLTSKLKYIFIIIYFIYSNNFRYFWSWKNFINS